MKNLDEDQIEKFFMTFSNIIKKISVSNYIIENTSDYDKKYAIINVIIVMNFIFSILTYLFFYNIPSNIIFRLFILLYIIYRIVYVTNYQLNVLLFSTKIKSSTRLVITVLLNYIEIIFWFATLYLGIYQYYNTIDLNFINGRTNSLYYSLSVMTLNPIDSMSFFYLKISSSFHLLIGFILNSITIAGFLGSLTNLTNKVVKSGANVNDIPKDIKIPSRIQVKKNSKNSSKKSMTRYEKYTLILVVISLLLSIGSYLQFKSVSNKANSLIRSQNDLQENVTNIQYELFQITNFNTTFIVSVNSTELKGSMGSNDDIRLNGYLEGTMKILTPHYGILKIRIKNFSFGDEFGNLNYEDEDSPLIRLDVDDDYILDIVNQGLNIIHFKIRVICNIKIKPEKFITDSDSIIFPIGDLWLENVFSDIQETTLDYYQFGTPVFARVFVN